MSSQKTKSTLVSLSKLDLDEARFIKPVLIDYNQNGERIQKWEAILAHDSVVVILYNKTTEKLVFVKQFRPAVMMSSIYSSTGAKREEPLKSDGYTLEFCAGIVDKEGKNIYEIAKEEILEEVGFDVDVKDIRLITSYRAYQSINGAIQYLFFAELDETKRVSQGGGIDGESIEVVELSIDECKEKVLYCSDEQAICSRSAALLFAISWFMHEYLAKLDKK